MKTSAGSAFIYLFLFCGMYYQCLSQTPSLAFGIRGGAGISIVSGEDSYPYNALDNSVGYSYNAGVLINIPLSESWSVQPELLYTRESTKYTGEYYRTTFFSKDSMVVNESMTTLRMPVLLKFSFGKVHAGQFNILAGLSLSHVLAGNGHAVGKTIRQELIDEETDLREHMKGFLLGVSVGMEYRLLDNLIVDIRLNHNLTSHFSEDRKLGSVYSNVLLGMGYLF